MKRDNNSMKSQKICNVLGGRGPSGCFMFVNLTTNPVISGRAAYVYIPLSAL